MGCQKSQVTIDRALITPVSKAQQGVFCFPAYSEKLESILQSLWGRPRLCLKVFKHQAVPLDEFRWGKNYLLTDCTKIQNLFAMHGLAPRVYGIVKVNDKYWAQVTDYVVDDGHVRDKVAVNTVMSKYGIKTTWDSNPKNWVGSQLVDFQTFWFSDQEKYKEKLSDRAHEVAAWGSRSEPYQAIEGMGWPSQRNTRKRAKMLRLDNLIGKAVLDIGCNLGAICHEADKNGAWRCVGVDKPQVAQLAAEVANWTGAWNIDFLGLNLPSQHQEIARVSGIEQFDTVFALSVDRQIGYGKWMVDLCADTFYLEGHVPDKKETYWDRLNRDFGTVEFLGMTRDHGPRPLFRCVK